LSVDLPDRWALAELGALGEWSGGGTPSKADKGFWTGGVVPWVSPKDMKKLFIRDTIDRITEAAVEASAAKMIPARSVLMVTRSGILAHTFPVSVNIVPVTVNQDLKALIPSPPLDYLYIAYYLRSAGQAILHSCSRDGTTVSSLDTEALLHFGIPIAPVREQHRIVEAVESYLTRLDDAVATLKRVQQNLTRYRASVLRAAVEGRLVPIEAELARREARDYEPASVLLDRILTERRKRWIEDAAVKGRAKAEEKAKKSRKPWTEKDDAKVLGTERAKAAKKYTEPATPDASSLSELPEGWCWTTLGALLREPLRNGHSARASKDGRGIRTLTLTAVTDGDFSECNTKVTVADPDRVSGLWLEPGDILVERSNTAELVGTAALYRGRPHYAIFPDLLIRVRLCDGALPLWTEAVLKSPRARRHFRSSAQGIAGSMPKISQATVADLAVPLPPLIEQKRIIDELERISTVTNDVAHVSTIDSRRSETLRQSILTWAFEGKLVDQDPHEEPASVLLERIRANRAAVQQTKKNNRHRGRRKKVI
jgi:type I restriction enzyme S subunit